MLYICPKCTLPLEKQNGCMKCPNGHSFDFSASGYVNLLLSNTKNHGDDAEMVVCRREFLNAGYYSPLCRAICSTVSAARPSNLLDAGCGEGYYTAALAETMPESEIYGIDISKKAAEKAAKRNKSLHISVGSIYNMPYADSCFDAAVNIFAPLACSEYLRVLKSGGTFITALPSPEHLLELKRIVYDEAVVKELKDFSLDGFELIKKDSLTYKMSLSNRDIKNLFTMTPYYHKTSPQNAARLDTVEGLEVTASFIIAEYRAVL